MAGTDLGAGHEVVHSNGVDDIVAGTDLGAGHEVVHSNGVDDTVAETDLGAGHEVVHSNGVDDTVAGTDLGAGQGRGAADVVVDEDLLPPHDGRRVVDRHDEQRCTES